ncbi:MAG: GNAT family N-acetyltransferase [Planctomycetes bacterium]|nr:GNAT family N-acetyltransferase [Planctomycetota bacterium]
MIEYRSFRNIDPPHLVTVWNEALPNRGAFTLRNATPFDQWVYSKPYFDPDGLIIACQDGIPVGFCHAGFGPNEEQSALDHSLGVISMIATRIALRRQHVGSELLLRGEDYLRLRGAKELYAGGMKPINPFYFGLYGGSNSPGFLESDPAMRPFFEARGYQTARRCLVFHRKLDHPLNVVDTRFTSLRKRFEVQVLPRSRVGTWWQECMIGQLEQFEFRLDEKATGQVAARALYWEMEGYGWRWNTPSIGIMDIQVRNDLRRQGVGKYLLVQLLRYLQEQYFGIAEVMIAALLTSALPFLQFTLARPKNSV